MSARTLYGKAKAVVEHPMLKQALMFTGNTPPPGSLAEAALALQKELAAEPDEPDFCSRCAHCADPVAKGWAG